MDISTLGSLTTERIKEAASTALTRQEADPGEFSGLLDQAIASLNTTNAYLSDSENEKLRWALGETESTHDLTIAMQKASTALQYTVAVRDKFLEAYRELMQMQV